MTEAKPAQSPETVRFYELMRFFAIKGGCCLTCSMDFAVAVVEKEAGREWKTQDCFAPERKCKERARQAWAQVPKRKG